jgi:hypothetical protein
MSGRIKKQTSVEELAKVFSCVHLPRRLCMKAMDCTRCLAESVLELGYRKIDEGSVVLTKEEYESLTIAERERLRGTL